MHFTCKLGRFKLGLIHFKPNMKIDPRNKLRKAALLKLDR